MKLNTKLYPKTIVLRRWMIIGFAIIVGAVILLFMHNMAQQSVKKKEAQKETAINNSSKSVTLASAQDMAWLSQAKIERAPGAEAAPSSPAQAISLNQASTISSSPSLTRPSSQKASSGLGEDSNNEIYQKQLEERQKAMMIPITANQLIAQPTDTGSSLSSMASGSGIQNSKSMVNAAKDDPNGQNDKEAFISQAKTNEEGVYLDKGVIQPRSPYELQVGSIIPAILVTGINSDLPGQIVGQIRQNVFDSITGNNVLIPQGAKVVGLYDSKVTYGQERVLVVWKRIVYPNGNSLDLSGMPGIDMSGYAGFNDQVNNHFMKIFGSVLLLSTMSAGAQLSQPNDNNSYYNNNYPTVGQTMAQSLGTNLSDFGTKLAEKNLDIQPTLVIRPGYEFNIAVTKDIVFPGAYHD